MLALLKPWRDIGSLKMEGETFEDTFATFIAGAPIAVQNIITNIQYFHDCADQAKREEEKTHASRNFSYAVVPPGEHLDEGYDEDESVEIGTKFISDEDILHACEGSINT
jgi:hypothetical protein